MTSSSTAKAKIINLHRITRRRRSKSIIQRDGWYIKFYFVDPDTVFISVHQ